MPALLGKARRRRRLGDRLAGRNADPDALTQEQQDKIALWTEYPWKFLTGTDVRASATLDFPHGRPIYWTKDEREKKMRPFPAAGYLREFLEHIHHPRIGPERFSSHECEVHAAVKSRQMIISTMLLGYFTQQCGLNSGRLSLISKVRREDAETLIEDKMRAPERGMPDWLRRHLGMSSTPRNIVRFRSGSRVVGVGENVADRDAVGNTASDILVDEASRFDDLVNLLAAAKPMASRIFLISTPKLGPPGSGADEFRQHVELSVEDALQALEEAEARH